MGERTSESEEPRASLGEYRKICAENDVARQYVMNRPLHRPKTSILEMVLWLAAYFVVCTVLNILFGSLVSSTEVLFFVSLMIWILPIVVFWRKIAVKIVECYQHYAKEEVRRRCLCMPTCSEYAILCFRKYSLIKALRMIRKRLKKTCRGTWYKIDFP